MVSESEAESIHRGVEKLLSELEKEMQPTGADLEVYRLGMSFESRGMHFYKEAQAELTDLRPKEPFAFLAGEEQKHCRILEDCYNYMENPAEYFHRKEGWHLEG